MLMNLATGFLVMILCLILQTFLIAAAWHYYVKHSSDIDSPSLIATLKIVSIVMLLLVLGNLGQIAVWALLFQALGEFTQFAEAFYHSAVNFSTLGYGDVVMSDQNKLLGPLEAINGILMVGVSTAVLLSTFQNAIKRTLQARSGSVDG